MSEAKIITVEPVARSAPVPAISSAVTPVEILRLAVEKGDLTMCERMMDLQMRWDAAEAKKAFDGAFAAFKGEAVTITKNRHVQFNETEYNHATLDQVVAAVIGALSKHGLSHHWETEQDDKCMINVSCVLTHERGHTRRVTLKGGADVSGKKNPIQALGSAVTYLSRYTLLAATGLAAAEQDDDGVGGPEITITEDQYKVLADLIAETKSNKAAFESYLNVKSLAELPASRFQDAITALNAKAATLAKRAKKEKEQKEAADA